MSNHKKSLRKNICVMGVLNITPDSFSDGGKYFNKARAIQRAVQMAYEGAGIIDVGGESTRPGASDVCVKEELSRIIPVIKAIADKVSIPVSVDTRKSEVAKAAVAAGASIINDISGLKYDRRMAKVAANCGATVILMHMKGTPQDMQRAPRYKDLVAEIKSGLRESIKIAKKAGIAKNKIVIDPGICFGKTVGHNLEILNRLDEFSELGFPVCVGVSRKSFIGKILGVADTNDRLAGTIAASVLAITKGASILRVHDVREMVEAAKITDMILNSGTR